jgi:hypothetical protein
LVEEASIDMVNEGSGGIVTILYRGRCKVSYWLGFSHEKQRIHRRKADLLAVVLAAVVLAAGLAVQAADAWRLR